MLTDVIFAAQKYRMQVEKRIRVGAVSYLNTKPLLYGIEHSEVKDMIDLSVDFPAAVARQLIMGEIDLGLVPVAIIPELQSSFIDIDYCIGADGPVGSVAIFSDVPLEQVTTIMLDYQSRTSVVLARILLKHFWKLNTEMIAAAPGYEKDIRGTVAGVVIGDRAFVQKSRSPYEYDLADAWKQLTGLPFVFAAWVANKPLPAQFNEAFNRANAAGLDAIDAVVAQNQSYPHDLKEYFTKNISYILDAEKRRGMALFLEYLHALKE